MRVLRNIPDTLSSQRRIQFRGIGGCVPPLRGSTIYRNMIRGLTPTANPNVAALRGFRLNRPLKGRNSRSLVGLKPSSG